MLYFQFHKWNNLCDDNILQKWGWESNPFAFLALFYIFTHIVNKNQGITINWSLANWMGGGGWVSTKTILEGVKYLHLFLAWFSMSYCQWKPGYYGLLT